MLKSKCEGTLPTAVMKLLKLGICNILIYLQRYRIIYNRIIYTGVPNSLTNLLTLPNRKAKKILPSEKLKCKITREFYFYKILDLYNDLKNEIKALPPNKFKIQLKKVLSYEGISR